MANEYEILEFLELDNMEFKTKRKRRRMQLRVENDPFDLDEAEFTKRYRLTKELTRELCDELRPLMRKPLKSTDLTVETKVLIALSFYATGSHQRPTGSSEGHFVAQQTVSSAISQVTASLNSPLIQEKYIQFPSTDQECNRIKTEFYNKYRIPGVLGCIGCSQVAIVQPALNKERYYCRKNFHALNIQLICDSDMQITSVDASHGGASHASSIWFDHPLRTHLEALSRTENTWLLGNSGYPLSKSMMTPILDTDDPREAYFTNLHTSAMNTIHRTVRLLKSRFRCLLLRKPLHYSPDMAGSIVNACVVLHNICNKANVAIERINTEDEVLETRLQQIDDTTRSYDDVALQQGTVTRNSLVQLV